MDENKLGNRLNLWLQLALACRALSHNQGVAWGLLRVVRYLTEVTHLYGVASCLNEMAQETEKSTQKFEISVPSSFLETIDKYVDAAQFASRNELIRASCRFYMEKHKVPFVTFPKR